LGFVGFDNNNLNFTAEGGAVHAFNGGRIDVFGVGIPATTSSRISQFLAGGSPYLSLINSTAGVGYKAYDIANENGAFSIRRIADGYTGVAGNLFRYTTTNTLILGDSSAKSNASYGSITVSGKTGTYAGIHFSEGFDSPVFMVNDTGRTHGMWSANSSGGWQWYYSAGNLLTFGGDGGSEGSFLGMYKGLNSLPGYSTNRYPTIRTDFSLLYLSAGGAFSAQIATNGTYTAVSDRNKKTIIEEIDCIEVLSKIEGLPITRFFFKDEDSRVTHIGTFAQDFWSEFECGGNQEIIDDDSPTSPNKMLATSDVAGVCLAGIQGLIQQNRQLKQEIDTLKVQLQ
jgi:hypothetical protein